MPVDCRPAFWTRLSRTAKILSIIGASLLVLVIVLLAVLIPRNGSDSDPEPTGSPTTTPSTFPTTSAAQSENFTKLLVVTGSSLDLMTAEIIDLSDENLICDPLTDFPNDLDEAVGGLGLDDEPLICGGKGQKDCYSYIYQKWVVSSVMNEERESAAMTRTPSKGLFITGGESDSKSAEILTPGGWNILPENLPVGLSQHCMVLVDESNVLVAGGMLDTNFCTSQTFFYNFNSSEWRNGPDLKLKRAKHACGMVQKDGNTNEVQALLMKVELGLKNRTRLQNQMQQVFKVVVLTGGYDQHASLLTETEILDLASEEWQLGPPLPEGIAHTQIVEESTGSVVIVGGYSLGGKFDGLLRLNDAKSEWIELPQKLTHQRYKHVAFLVPDAYANCIPSSK